jgi:hypothetical protein
MSNQKQTILFQLLFLIIDDDCIARADMGPYNASKSN